MDVDENWKPIPGYVGFYEASDLGRIRSTTRDVICFGGTRKIQSKVLKPVLDADGYGVVSISLGGQQKTRPVHRLVALTFLGPLPEGQQTRHLNGDKADCSSQNLAYGSPVENWQDRKAHGNGIDGLKNPNAKLTAAEVNEIVSLKGQASYAAIGRLFGISDSHTRKIIRSFA